MVFDIDIDSDLDELALELRTIKVKDALDDSMEDVMENEFVPYLTNKIKSEGLVGEGPDKGPGPHLSSEDAWEVERVANMDYRVKTIPVVSERAFYLEFGTSAQITPTNSETLKFESTQGSTAGDMIYPVSVDGVKEYSFFRDAISDFDAKDRFINAIGDDVTDHIRDNLRF